MHPCFSVELQDEIWEWHTILSYSDADPVPEVCILAPLLLDRPPNLQNPRSPVFNLHNYWSLGPEIDWESRDLYPDGLDPPSVEAIYFPLTVDSAYPTLLHACHSSRAFMLRYIRLIAMESQSLGDNNSEDGHVPNLPRLRYSPKAQAQVPFRLFNPQIDTLYMTSEQHIFLARVLAPPPGDNYDHIYSPAGHDSTNHFHPNADLEQIRCLTLVLNATQHLAVGTTLAITGHNGDGDLFLSELIIFHMPNLLTLTLVLPGSRGKLLRSRLRALTPSRSEEDAQGGGIKVALVDKQMMQYAKDNGFIRRIDVSSKGDESVGREEERDWLWLDEYLELWKLALDEAAVDIYEFDPLHLKTGAAVFEEWRIRADYEEGVEGGGGYGRGKGGWEEVCEKRKFGTKIRGGGQVRYIAPEGRASKNPLEYRVLDDDCGRYGVPDEDDSRKRWADYWGDE
ncbi:hypothetical protein V8F33_011152 [Rhypophila sp. PSN 637]